MKKVVEACPSGHRYEGRYGKDNPTVFKNGQFFPPGLSLALCEHSPTGFTWGYGGSGCAQLALALLLDVTGDAALALSLYHDYKWAVVAKFSWNWALTTQEIQDWVTQHARKEEVSLPDAIGKPLSEPWVPTVLRGDVLWPDDLDPPEEAKP